MKKQEKLNQCLRLLDNSYNIKANVIKINTHNNLLHEVAKLKKCYSLIKEGKEVYTEVTFKKPYSGRADILVPELFLVIEILDTETIEKFNKKKLYYPECLNIVGVRAEDV